MIERECSVPGCGKPARPGRDLCHGHARRKERGKPLDGPLRPYRQPPWDRIEAAAFDFAMAEEGDPAKELAKRRLRDAIHDWKAAGEPFPEEPELASDETGEAPAGATLSLGR